MNAQQSTPATRPTSDHLLEDPIARHNARERDRVRQLEERLAAAGPRPALGPMGAALAVLVAVILIIAQWDLYPQSAESQTNATWALGVAILASGTGMRILVGEPGRHLLATIGILLGGLVLVLRSFLAPHDATSTAVLECVCGIFLLLGGLVALASPATELEE